MNEEQLAALVDAAVAEAVSKTRDALKAEFDATTTALKKNRDEILAEKKALEAKGPKTGKSLMDMTVEEFKAHITKGKNDDTARSTKPDAMPAGVPAREQDGTIVIPSNVSPSEYRRLRELAEKEGVRFRVPYHGEERMARQRTAPMVHDFEARGRRYVSTQMIDELGGPIRARQKLGSDVIVFKSLEDLNDDALAAHNAARVT